MQIPPKITFRNFKVSHAVRTAILDKIDWLEKFSPQIIRCEVVISKPHKHHQKGNLFQVSIDLRLPGQQLAISRSPSARKPHQDPYVTIHDAFDEARREIEEYIRKRRAEVKTLVSPPRGRVVRLIEDDGRYGFIRTDDERELYFHSHAVLNDRYEDLIVGTEVRFAEEMGNDGPQASTIEILGKERRTARKSA